MTESLTSILDNSQVKLVGRSAFVLSAGGWTINTISQMEFIQPWVVIATGLLSIIYIGFKITMIRIEFIEKREERAKANKPKISFFPTLFKWTKKNSTSKK